MGIGIGEERYRGRAGEIYVYMYRNIILWNEVVR
jgi:hypothetical protein